MFTDVFLQMIFGFGALMLFITEYGMSSMAFCFLITAIAFQWSIFTDGFFNCVYSNTWDTLPLDIVVLINALYAVAAVLITFGAVIGKTTPLQLVVLTMMELVFFSFNRMFMMLGVFNLQDAGCSIITHLFGAYFGVGVSLALGSPKAQIPTPGYLSDVLSMFGMIMLVAYYPSFNAGTLDVDSDEAQRAIVNTVISLFSATTVSFATSSLMSADGKFRAVDIQNGPIAGGVVIGVVANLSLAPYTISILGMIAGFVSTFGFNKIQPYLEQTIGLHDSCGVHNLHGMPAIIGGLASVVIAAYKNSEGRAADSAIYGPDGGSQWWKQLLGVVVTLGIGLAGGGCTGWVMRYFFEPAASSSYAKYMYKDSAWFSGSFASTGSSSSTTAREDL